jgi:hypothetical protein
MATSEAAEVRVSWTKKWVRERRIDDREERILADCILRRGGIVNLLSTPAAAGAVLSLTVESRYPTEIRL